MKEPSIRLILPVVPNDDPPLRPGRNKHLSSHPRHHELAHPRNTGIYSVKCDVHGWMQAYIRVDDHPYHAVTDARGKFRIEGIPPGTYTLELWHERLGPMEQEVTIPETGHTSIDIEYSP